MRLKRVYYPLDEYICLDLETTGLKPQSSEILEVGMIRVKNKRAIEKMEVLIRPEKPVPGSVTRLTGITNEMVHEAPTIQEVHKYIWDFIGNLPIVGYNIRFDLGFLRQHADVNRTVEYLDVYPLCKKAHPFMKHCRLSDMTSRYHLHKNNHRACDDALATAQLYELSKKNFVR